MKMHIIIPTINNKYIYRLLFIHFLLQMLFSQSPLIDLYSFADHPNSNIINGIQIKPSYVYLSWYNKPVHFFSTRIYGDNETFSFIIEPSIVNEPYGPDILGIHYVRSGVSMRITNAFIRYHRSIGEVTLGRAPINWGVGNHSIISSKSVPSIDQFSVNIKFGLFQLKLLSGQLDSGHIVGDRIKRLIAGQNLTWNSATGKLKASFGQQIIYTGINRSIEFQYFSPFIPYFFSALEGEEETATGNNDNSLMFSTLKYQNSDCISLYCELIIDDFQIDDTDLQDGLGYKIGIEGALDVANKPIILELELTTINSWTYIHQGQFTSWQNRGHALGYQYGPDLRSLHAQAELWLKNNLKFDSEVDLLQKGNNILSSNWENLATQNNSFPKPPVTNHILFATSISWIWQYGLVKVGWSNYTFSNHIANSYIQPKPKGGIFFEIQFFKDFTFI